MKENETKKEKSAQKKEQNKVAPKIEIEFIGQKEEEARMEQEKKLKTEEMEKKNKKKFKKEKASKQSGKTLDFTENIMNKKRQKELEEVEKLDFTIQGLVDDDEIDEVEEKPKQKQESVKKQPEKKQKQNQKNKKIKQEKINNPKQKKITKITEIPNVKVDTKKHRRIVLIIMLIFFLGLTLVSLYFMNPEFQANMDEYVFRKNKESEDLIAITLDSSKNPEVIAYNGTLSVLAENNLKIYNAVGSVSGEIALKVNNPIYETDGKYLIIGEKNQSKIYLVDSSNVAWENEIDGNISRVEVNKNGYSAIVITGTSYKSIIAVFDKEGKELFRIYLSTTSVVDIDISEDNKYLGIAEIDTTGTQIQSIIKMVEIEKAQITPKESIVYTHQGEAGEMIVDIAFHSKNKLICMYDDCIHATTLSGDEELMELTDDQGKTNYAEINLDGNIYRVIEQSAGLFKGSTMLEIMDTNNKKKTVHTVEGITKGTISEGNTIVLNLGSEVEFLTSGGWIMKNYTTTRTIKDIVVSGNTAGIVYRDRVEIINL